MSLTTQSWQSEFVSTVKSGAFEGFKMVYQPIVQVSGDGQSVEMRSVEALMRYNSAGFAIPPNEFIPFCEDKECMCPLGEFAIKRSLQDFEPIGGQSKVGLNVNVSYKQLLNPIFVERFNQILAQFTHLPATLTLEITESCHIKDLTHANKVIAELKSLGNIKIAMDDYGTGFSSMYQLSKLNFDVLKLDKAFVFDIENCKGSKAIVKNFYSLANDLDVTPVVEGVENNGQFDVLLSMGFTAFQGWLFHKPEPICNLRLPIEQSS